MGDHGRLAGRDALDEMGHAVAALLAAVGDDLPDGESSSVRRAVIPERSAELPDLTELDSLLTHAETGWVEWRQRLAELQRRVKQPLAG